MSGNCDCERPAAERSATASRDNQALGPAARLALGRVGVLRGGGFLEAVDGAREPVDTVPPYGHVKGLRGRGAAEHISRRALGGHAAVGQQQQAVGPAGGAL